MFNTIIFDLDGTLVDTEKYWVEATKKLLQVRYFVVNEKLQSVINTKVRGKPLIEVMTIIKDMFLLSESPHELLNEELSYVKESYSKMTFVHGALEFIKLALALNYKIAIASNTSRYLLDSVNESLLLDKYFGSHMYCIDDVDNGKPDPEIFLLALKKLNSLPEETIVIGDSSSDFMASNKANIKCYGINTSYSINNSYKNITMIKEFKDICLL